MSRNALDTVWNVMSNLSVLLACRFRWWELVITKVNSKYCKNTVSGIPTCPFERNNVCIRESNKKTNENM